MKISLLIYLIVLISCNQKPMDSSRIINSDKKSFDSNIDTIDNKIYTIVDEMPRFPGCEDKEYKIDCADMKFLEYLYKNLNFEEVNTQEHNYPELTLLISFIIEKDGSISTIEIIKGRSTIEKSNFIQLIENMPNWTPGKLKGIIKRVKFNLPYKIHLK